MQCDKPCTVPEGVTAYAASLHSDRSGSKATDDKQLSSALRFSHLQGARVLDELRL